VIYAGRWWRGETAKATAAERGERGRLGMKTRRCGILTSVEAAKVMMAWRARTPTVRSGAAATSDMALDGTRGEAAVGLSARSGRAVGRHLYGAGVGVWQPRGNGALTGGPGVGSGG
jgi:hypothetical protein